MCTGADQSQDWLQVGGAIPGLGGYRPGRSIASAAFAAAYGTRHGRREIVAVRRRHPRWGPRKLLVVLRRQEPTSVWPAVSTVGEILKHQGLVRRRRRRRYSAPYADRLADYAAPNAIWCADFKGHFPVADARCHPLTIMDGFSRYRLRCEPVADAPRTVSPEDAGRAGRSGWTLAGQPVSSPSSTRATIERRRPHAPSDARARSKNRGQGRDGVPTSPGAACSPAEAGSTIAAPAISLRACRPGCERGAGPSAATARRRPARRRRSPGGR